MLLLDTNICILLMKNKFPALTQKLLGLDPSRVAVSSVTVYELAYGAAKSNWPEKNMNLVRLFLAPFSVIPFDSGDAFVAGEIRRLLAAQGLARGYTVVTHNTGEFLRVPNLRVEDWIG